MSDFPDEKEEAKIGKEMEKHVAKKPDFIIPGK